MSTEQATQRVYNFSPGPAMLPLPVLERAQAELLCLPGAGASVMEISHRSPAFGEILDSARRRLRQLLGIPDDYEVLLLQGGSRLQFAMAAMNLLRGAAQPAQYLLSGSWSVKALDEARRQGPTEVVWDGRDTNYDRLPNLAQLPFSSAAPYIYLTSNETIQGVQFDADLPLRSAPVVCDASSDFLSRPVPVSRYGLIFACAQKNAGPAGVTVVIIRRDLLQRSSDELPGYLNYREHADNNSLYNTPPTFAIYMLELVCQWLQEEMGGLAAMHQRNLAKASQLYAVIDDSGGFYQGHAQPDCRSLMNVTFRLPDAELESRFLAAAGQRQLDGLKGHRSVGGIRASIYNAMPPEGVDELCRQMREFQSQHG